jgi:hypothetical protein
MMHLGLSVSELQWKLSELTHEQSPSSQPGSLVRLNQAVGPQHNCHVPVISLVLPDVRSVLDLAAEIERRNGNRARALVRRVLTINSRTDANTATLEGGSDGPSRSEGVGSNRRRR